MNWFLIILAIITVALAMYGIYIQISDNENSKGQVYYVNFKPESDSVLQEVAQLYTKKLV